MHRRVVGLEEGKDIAEWEEHHIEAVDRIVVGAELHIVVGDLVIHIAVVEELHTAAVDLASHIVVVEGLHNLAEELAIQSVRHIVEVEEHHIEVADRIVVLVVLHIVAVEGHHMAVVRLARLLARGLALPSFP